MAIGENIFKGWDTEMWTLFGDFAGINRKNC